MTRSMLVLLLALIVTRPALADTRPRRTAIVAFEAEDVVTKQIALQIATELRMLVGKPVDIALVKGLAGCKVRAKCLAELGAGVAADRVIFGSVRMHEPGYHVHLELVDVKKRRYERMVDAVMWQDMTDVTVFRAWVRTHYAKLRGARGARSS